LPPFFFLSKSKIFNFLFHFFSAIRNPCFIRVRLLRASQAKISKPSLGWSKTAEYGKDLDERIFFSFCQPNPFEPGEKLSLDRADKVIQRPDLFFAAKGVRAVKAENDKIVSHSVIPLYFTV
jgi:hypothetical protein